jgi:hypothetical protein
MSEELKLGKIIDQPQGRDAVHIAVVPVVAGELLQPGTKVGFTDKANNVVGRHGPCLGVVDPYLQYSVTKGQTFWMFLIPGSITSLRHEWTHPEFEAAPLRAVRDASEEWMRSWARANLCYQYGEHVMDENAAYDYAISFGHEHHVGSFEDSRDNIDDEWWDHWEKITGEVGDREAYFSCAC